MGGKIYTNKSSTIEKEENIMEKGLIFALKSRFDNIAHVDEESGIEFWYARELQKELGYQRWENFMIAIERAETACVNSKIECHNHFREVTKMVTIGSSAERGIPMIKRSGIICSLLRFSTVSPTVRWRIIRANYIPCPSICIRLIKCGAW